MKHLILDTGIVLDFCLQRGEFQTIDNLLKSCQKYNVKLWFSSASLGSLDDFLQKELLKKVSDKKRALSTSRELLTRFLEHIDLLSNFGFDQYVAIAKAEKIGDAQTALAANSLQGEKILVTYNENFDTLGLINIATPSEALEWVHQETKNNPINFIDLSAQQDVIKPQIEKRIHTVLRHSKYILGPEVKELEMRLCDYTGAKYCIGVSSGTDALIMPLMAWGVGPGDAVFTTPFTFIATAEVIRLLGATPVFVDIDSETFNLDPQCLESAIEATIKNDPSIYPLPQTGALTPKAIIPVDLFGLPADYDAIMAIAQKNRLKVLSDSAQGFGSKYHGKRSGTLAHATATSFFPAKPLGAYGDGGAIFTDDHDLAAELESIRVHGKGLDKYDNIRLGLNARLDTVQAAVLLSKLEIFDWELARKQAVADHYSQLIHQNARHLRPPEVPKGLESAWAQYSVLAEDKHYREKFLASLTTAGILCGVYYPKPLHLQTVFLDLGYKEGDFPNSEAVSNRIFSLPMHGYLSRDQRMKIIETIS